MSRVARLIMVTPTNNNKFYNMEQRNCKGTYLLLLVGVTMIRRATRDIYYLLKSFRNFSSILVPYRDLYNTRTWCVPHLTELY